MGEKAPGAGGSIRQAAETGFLETRTGVSWLSGICITSGLAKAALALETRHICLFWCHSTIGSDLLPTFEAVRTARESLTYGSGLPLSTMPFPASALDASTAIGIYAEERGRTRGEVFEPSDS